MADLEIQKGGGGRVSGCHADFHHVKVRTEYLKATLGLVKRLNLTKIHWRGVGTRLMMPPSPVAPGCGVQSPLLPPKSATGEVWEQD